MKSYPEVPADIDNIGAIESESKQRRAKKWSRSRKGRRVNLHDRATNHHPYLLPRADVVRRTWLEPQSRSSPATPFWTVAKHTTTLALLALLSPPTFLCSLRACTYVRTSPRTLVSLHSSPRPPPFLYPPLRGSHDGGRNMQIREINARKFHYNSTRKISSSSCDPPPPPTATPSFLTAPCNHFSLAHPREAKPRPPSCRPFRTIQEHPHYLVLPHSPRKMAEKVAGKTVLGISTVPRWLLASSRKPTYFLVRQLLLLPVGSKNYVQTAAQIDKFCPRFD